MNTGMIRIALELRDAVDALTFSAPVSCVYNPLRYAWEPYRHYLEKWGAPPRRVVFVGMNPGPWGMAQVGVPFGEIGIVRDWLGIRGRVERPAREHPRRPVRGFACTRSEVSGRRLWGAFAARFGTAGAFFREHIVVNYCPLMFLDEAGRNITPDKLSTADRQPLYEVCDRHLRGVLQMLDAEWVIGIGRFAALRAQLAAAGTSVRAGEILHPSPASPRANRDWRGAAEAQLQALGLWS